MKRTILLAGILLVMVYGAVSAHGLEPVKANPEAGSHLSSPPTEVRLWFDEEIGVEGSLLRVEDAQGNVVDLGGGGVDLNDPQRSQLAVALPELPQGAYKVVWTVALLDGDSSVGEYWFGVGDVLLPAAIPEDAAEAGQPTGVSPSGWIILAAGVVLIGVAAGIWLGGRRKQD